MTTERAAKSKPPDRSKPQQHEEETKGLVRPVDPIQAPKLQNLVGNQAMQRMVAEGRMRDRQSHFNGLPPVRGVKKPPKDPAETETAGQEFAEETVQEAAPAAMLQASGSAPPPPNTPPNPANRPDQPEINQTSGAPGVQRIFGALAAGAEWLFKKALSAAGVPIDLVWGFLKKAGSAFMNIIRNPGEFLGNLIDGIKQGFSQFTGNIMNHLKAGFLSWLFGALTSAGIEVPKEFSMKSILSLVMQILGITVDAIRQRLVKFIGQKNVARIEKAWSIISKFISEGVGGLWEMVKDYLSDLKTMVVDEIKNWVIVEIVKGAVIKLLSMFNPAGALIQIITTIYKIVKFFIERASQIASLVEAITGSVAAIAAGNVSLLAQKIEQSLAKAIPVVIGFLASLLGIGGIANKVREIIQRIQKKVQDAIDSALKKIANGVKKLFGGKGGSAQEQKKALQGDADKQAKVKTGLAAFDVEEKKYLKEGAITKANAEQVASSVKKQHPVFASIRVVEGVHKDAKTWDYDYSIVQRTTKEGEPAEEEKKADTFKFDLPLASRHRAGSIRSRSIPRGDGKNSVVVDWDSVRKDVEDINAGKAKQEGNRFTLPNGRIYETDNPKGTHLWPVGPEEAGIYPLSRAAFKILGLLNENDGNMDVPRIQKDPSLQDPADREAAMNVWKKL